MKCVFGWFHPVGAFYDRITLCMTTMIYDKYLDESMENKHMMDYCIDYIPLIIFYFHKINTYWDSWVMLMSLNMDISLNAASFIKNHTICSKYLNLMYWWNYTIM